MIKLLPPFEISSRLMTAVTIGKAVLSVELSGNQSSDGRDIYDIYIDLPDGTEHHVTDMKSGCQGGSVRDGMSALLSFLGAAAESRNYRERTGDESDNEDLFTAPVVEWAAANEDEIACVSCELDENPTLIEEN